MSNGISINDRGSLLVELCFTLPLFILVMLIGIETLRLSYSNIAAQIIADRGVEWVRTSPCCVGGVSAHDASEGIRVRLVAFAKGLGITNNPTICITPQTDAPNCLTDPNATIRVAGPRELFVIRVRYRINLLFGITQGAIDAIGVGRHEPKKM